MWLEPGDKSGMQGREVTGSRDLVIRGFINHLKNCGFYLREMRNHEEL